MTDPQYKPGDIVNGHRLTVQPDGTLAWLPVEAAPAVPPKKKPGTGQWIAFGVSAAVVLALLTFGIVAVATGNRNADPSPAAASESLTPGQQAEREAAEEEPAEEPEPAPLPEVGTLANPGPVGGSASVTAGDGTSYDISYPSTNFNANEAVATENQFNDAAAPGYHYVIVTVQVTNTTSDAAKALRPGSAVYGLTLTDQNGASYSQSFVVLPNDLSSQADIYQGQTATGEVAFMVPDSTVTLVAGLAGVFIQI